MYHEVSQQADKDLTAGKLPSQGLMRSINLRDLWAPVYRSRIAISAIFLVMLGLAVSATLLIQPRYRATSTLEIRSETQKVLGTEDQDERASSSNDATLFLNTQLDVIRSRTVAAAVAESLGLYNNDGFLAAMSIKPHKTEGRVLNEQEAHRKLVLQTLLDNLKVKLSSDTRIAEVTFSSPDPRLAQRIANSLAENYIRLNLARRFDASSYSLDFLRNQITEAQQRLSRSERDTINYARSAQLIDTSNASGSTANDPGPQSLTTASLIGLNQALSGATTKRVVAEERWNVAQLAGLLTIPEVAANPTVQQLQQQRAQVQAQYQQELQTRREDYPSVQQFAARSAELNRQIMTIATNVKNTLHEEFISSRAQEEGLRSTLDRLKTATLNEQARSIQLSILRRGANTNRQQLDALLKRFNEVNAQAGVQLNNLSIVDRAEVPSGAYWPSALLNVALGLVLSILLSAIYVLGRENLFEMVRTPEDVSGRLRLPLLGAIPISEDVLGDVELPKTGIAEAFNSIRTSLSLSSAAGTQRAITVTSTQAGEGKSTVCYGLAQGLARLGRSVIIVDADLRRPNIHRIFKLQNQMGVSNILSGSASIENCLIPAVMPRLDLLVAGPVPPDATELLGSDKLAVLIRELCSRYDHVLVDSAPMLGLADAPLVAASVDGVIFVVEAARNSIRAVQTAIRRLQQSSTPLIGVVLSRFDASSAGYSYEYQYSYEYSYGNRSKA